MGIFIKGVFQDKKEVMDKFFWLMEAFTRGSGRKACKMEKDKFIRMGRCDQWYFFERLFGTGNTFFLLKTNGNFKSQHARVL